ncbi:GIY-YIG nuclease family protein [Stappia sp. F7233]|uniref:GIY-YIG nuclease family protein n=1 Tax=Stappia albiluteola TaxID=2758565 RepID=A0A839A9I9_9HYPH|nr:GIY-YIG nuclease family protein [Stappia albiluteola]MBA5775795.1 GIY-YIG nuclease family protein [Stappia albiluteola]
MARDHNYYLYIVASGVGGTLYIGVTNDLARRISEHREGIGSAFARRYSVHRLVYYEHFMDVGAAIAREKQLKRWNRAWKIRLIEENNPDWVDLFPSLFMA